jgi:hypothetical protein
MDNYLIRYGWIVVTIGTIVVCIFLDEFCDRWPLLKRLFSLRVFRRSCVVEVAVESEDVIDSLLRLSNPENETYVSMRKIQEDEYSLEIPMGKRIELTHGPTQSMVVGLVRFDAKEHTIELTARLTPTISFLLLVLPMIVASLALFNRKPAAAFLFLVLSYGFVWMIPGLKLRQKLDDVWFELTTNLHRSREI